MMMKNYLFAGLVFILMTVVSGFPRGAGSCLGGRAAVGGLHNLKKKGWWQNRNVVSKSYDDANVIVTVNGVAMSPGGGITLPVGTAYTISVRGQDIKGLLVRAQAANEVVAKQTMTAGTNTKIAEVCDTSLIGPSITGITHKDRSKKNSFDGTIQFDEAADVSIDVTVVFYNEYWRGASHAYGQFNIKFTEGGIIP